MTADLSTLQALLERVQAASGADRELDALIHLVCEEDRIVWWEGNTLYSRHRSEPADHKWLEGAVDPGRVARNWSSADYRHPAYTASLDAALALVERVLPKAYSGVQQNRYPPGAPEDRSWNGYVFNMGEEHEGVTRPSPALALLCALLTALIAQAKETTHAG